MPSCRSGVALSRVSAHGRRLGLTRVRALELGSAPTVFHAAVVHGDKTALLSRTKVGPRKRN